ISSKQHHYDAKGIGTMKKAVWLAVLALVLVISACGGSNKGNEASPSPKGSSEAPAADKKLYIPIISKGFQHQFWQAVKIGAEKAAAEFGVEITFEGPETEAQVDKQLEMLQV